MVSIINIQDYYDIPALASSIKERKPYETMLQGPTDASREFISKALEMYLKEFDRESIHNLMCLCMEEIISNSVKANIKRAYFIHNKLDINDPEQYQAGMQHFRELGMSKVKQVEFISFVQDLGFYVKIRFSIDNDILTITTRNNSIISPKELERINNKVHLSENKTSEDIFMNSVDMTEGCGLGIIMIKKIMDQVSTIADSFSISADETDTITELKINI